MLPEMCKPKGCITVRLHLHYIRGGLIPSKVLTLTTWGRSSIPEHHTEAIGTTGPTPTQKLWQVVTVLT